MQKTDFVSLGADKKLRHTVSGLQKKNFECLQWLCQEYVNFASYLPGQQFRDPKLIWLVGVEDAFHNSEQQREQLLKLLIERAADTVPVEFVIGIKLFARIDGFEEYLLRNHAVDTLMRVMTDNINNVPLITHGVHTLVLLATEDEIREEMSSGSVQLLVQIMDSYSSDEQMFLNILKALTNIFYHSVNNKKTFVDAGGLRKLMEIINKGSWSTTTVEYTCVLLRNLCSIGKHREKLLEEDFFVCLMGLFECYRNIVQAQIHLLWALLNATINSKKLKTLVGHCGGSHQILETIRAHPTFIDLQQVAIRTLHQLCTISTNMYTVGTEGGVRDLLQVLSNHSDDGDIPVLCLKTLLLLCDNPVPREKLHEGNCIPYLISFLEDMIEDRELVEYGLEIFGKIAQEDSGKASLEKHDVMAFISSAQSQYFNDELVRSLCAKTIESLGGFDMIASDSPREISGDGYGEEGEATFLEEEEDFVEYRTEEGSSWGEEFHYV